MRKDDTATTDKGVATRELKETEHAAGEKKEKSMSSNPAWPPSGPSRCRQFQGKPLHNWRNQKSTASTSENCFETNFSNEYQIW